MKGEDAKHCKKCKWHGKLSGMICCDYILMNEEPRGCKAGVECEKFTPKKKGFMKQNTAYHVGRVKND